MTPKIEGSRGLRFRRRAGGWVAYWVARADLVKRGYSVETQRLWAGSWPSVEDEIYLRKESNRLQSQMLEWATGHIEGAASFDGTLGHLINIYRKDPDSPYQRLRHKTQQGYDYCLNILKKKGDRRLHTLSGRDFVNWYAELRSPKKKGGPERIRRAHAVMTMLRELLRFGTSFEIGGIDGPCPRLNAIIKEMEFENSGRRAEAMTAGQATAICAAAHKAGSRSIALAQALQFDLTLRQKDVIGEWVPVSETGLSDVTDRLQKWIRGLRWEEISSDLILKHATSKTGQVAEFDLKLYPMVMAELAHWPEDQRKGPMIVCETTGLPYRQRHFIEVWRGIADKAEVPRSVWNMDSRAGGITEATSAGADLELARHHAQHSNVTTTQRYSRGTLDKTRQVAVLRAKHREKK